MAKRSANPWDCAQNCPVQPDPLAGLTGGRTAVMKPALLLHSCCGPCSTAVIERLAPDYDLTVFYYNPCITDPAEYEKRKLTQIAFLDQFNQQQAGLHRIEFLEGPYEPEAYRLAVRGHEADPEGGARCGICFAMRLEKTAATARDRGYGIFTTTLTVSPHKEYRLISSIGAEMAARYGVEFLDRDFKKQAGFQRSVQMAKAYGLYRQSYCGCEYAKR